MKVLLLRPSEEWVLPGFVGHTPAATSLFPPLGLLYLAAVLEKQGHSPEIIDLGIERLSEEQLHRAVTSADVVGLSVYTKNFQETAALSKRIKEIDPSIPQIIGGPHCIFMKEQSLVDIPTADVCCFGEGELVIPDVLRALQGKKRLSNVHGISYRTKRGIRTGKPLQVISDLDSLPFPARHLVKKYTYTLLPGIFQRGTRLTTMMTSRGCPFHCRFCSRYGNIIDHYGFRQRSAENVVKEIIALNETHDSVMIVDDNFLADNRRAHRIFDLLIQSGTTIDLMIVGARIDSADKALYKKMRQAHVTFISYGIESGNQDVLDFYQKKITVKQIRDTLRMASDSQFLTMGYFIFGAPIETQQHLEKTMKFACSLPLDIALFGLLNYEMGSSLWYQEVKNKKIALGEFIVPSDVRRGLGMFTAEELRDTVHQAYRRFYLRPSYVINQISRSLLRKDYRVLRYGFRFITHL